MIDVHAPHGSTHTLKDFLIHMTAICLGLLIAIALEQSVEYIHHSHERNNLRDDLRAQAEEQIRLLHQNQLVCAESVAWSRAILEAGRHATPAGGFVTYVLPSRKGGPSLQVLANGVWTAAKSSGGIALLSRDEIVTWDQIDYLAQITDKSFQDREVALQKLYGLLDRTDSSAAPGATVHLTTADRDEQVRDLGSLIEATWMIERNSALWEGADQAVLHGATTSSAMTAYEGRALKAMPK
ncbi:MAG TPA: hypothetical protein VFW30_03215 [Bryocella sp.]|nr:hypothetical protein [Bryocella sp.]